MIVSPSSDSQTPSRVVSAWKAIELVWDIILGIAIPTGLFALGGRWLDRRWNVSPLFLILGLVAAFVVATIIVMKKVKYLQALMRKTSQTNSHD